MPTLNEIKIIDRGERYVTKYSLSDFEDKFKIKYRAQLTFASEEEKKEAIADCPWLLKRTKWGKENRELGEKYEQQIKQGYCVPVLVAWIRDEIGYGLLSSKVVEQGAFIGEYTGLCRKLNRTAPHYNGYCFKYPTKLFTLHYWVIDAEKEGNLLRFINHSDNANIMPQWVLDEEGLLHMCFFAKRTIFKGEQLTFDYGDDYWLRTTKFEN